MAITINRTPMTIDSNYKDEGQYFNQTQFKGLCSNQNVDSIDPSTFSDVENLYVDSDNTLASRPKLKPHDNFGFTSIEKMWIWGDVHLIYGTLEEQKILKDIINNESLDLTEETLNQIIRIENRIFVFLEGKVYVYEKLEDVYSFTEVTPSNVDQYFYIPEEDGSTKVGSGQAESKNELTSLKYKFVLFENMDEAKLYIPYLENVTIKLVIGDKTYKIGGWYKDPGLATIVAPYTKQVFDKMDIAVPKNVDGTYSNTISAVASLGSEIFYTLDGVVWSTLPSITAPALYTGISKDGNFAWALKCRNEYTSDQGLFIISLVATEYPDGNTDSPAIKKYPEWTKLYYPGAINTPNLTTASGSNLFYYFHPTVSMLTWDRWVVGACGQMYGSYEIFGAYGHDEDENIIFGQSNFSNDISGGSVYNEMVGSNYWGIMDMQVYASYDLYNNTDKKYIDYIYLKLITKITDYATNDKTPTVVRLAFNAVTVNDTTYTTNPLSYHLNKISDMGTSSQNLGGNSTRLGNTIATNCYQTLSEMPPYIEKVGDQVNFYFTCVDFNDNSFDDPIRVSTYNHLVYTAGTVTVYSAEVINRALLGPSQIPSLVAEPPIGTCVGKIIMMKNANEILTESFLLKWKNTVSTSDDINSNNSACTISSPSVPIKYKPSPVGEETNVLIINEPTGGFYTSDYSRRRSDNSILAFNEILTAYYSDGNENELVLYTNKFSQIVTLKWYSETPSSSNIYTNLYPQHNVETDNTQYWSFDQTLYIESRRYTEDFKPLLYFPEINTEIRPRKITNLLVIDRGIVALFNDYEVWYVTKVTLEDSQIGYAYYKSRIGLGCKEGADIDIMYDGATITYASPRGIVGMNYQQLTQNTDQILTFLSDSITEAYFPFYGDGKIKIFKYRFWVVFYKENTYKCLILDLRNTSWWVWDSKIDGGLKEIYLYQDEPLILDKDGHLMSLDTTHAGIYKDLDTKIIDWKATSQPLTFGAINNYKRINSININSVQLTKEPFNYILICRNYKNQKNIYAPKVVNFEQEKITVGNYRTFVKRLNYIQSVKFQYTVANNSDLPIQTPISITAISTKYEIKGRVR